MLNPVQSPTLALKLFSPERKYPKECAQARLDAFEAAVDWVLNVV